jgi:hypothetical protein
VGVVAVVTKFKFKLKFTTTKVPRQYPFLLLVTEVVNVFFGGGAALGGIIMLIWGANLGRNFEVKIGRLHERHGVQRGTWVPTQPLL